MTSRPPILTDREQQGLALLVAIALATSAILWWSQGGPGGGLIEIDRAPRLEYAFRIDLNQADWPELAQLPEIGPVLAQRIVAYRREHGDFRAGRELLDVPGIGPRKWERVRGYLLPLPDDTMVAGP